MAATTYSPGVVINSPWLTDVNNLVWGVFNGATTPAQARTALGVSQTGQDTTYAFRANNGSDFANPATVRTNIGAAASGANTDITSLASPALASATATTQAALDNTTKVATTAFVTTAIALPVLSKITISLLADVNLTNTTLYFDGPSLAQGTTGIWLVTGNVTITNAGGLVGSAKLWDGTTIIDSTSWSMGAAVGSANIHLSGIITNPAANLRISVKDTVSTSGKILFNLSGNSKDSTLTAIRIG